MPHVQEFRRPDPDCCANCDNLRWGQNQGFDLCFIDGHGIDWARKENLVCECHVRSIAKDPRKVKRSKTKERLLSNEEIFKQALQEIVKKTDDYDFSRYQPDGELVRDIRYAANHALSLEKK